MGKKTPDAIIDAQLAVIGDAATEMYLLAAEPADRAAAVAGALATVANPTIGAPANGDTDGRKRTVAAVTDVAVAVSGTANHVALADGAQLLKVTTAPAQAVAAGGTVDIGAWPFEIGDDV